MLTPRKVYKVEAMRYIRVAFVFYMDNEWLIMLKIWLIVYYLFTGKKQFDIIKYGKVYTRGGHSGL